MTIESDTVVDPSSENELSPPSSLYLRDLTVTAGNRCLLDHVDASFPRGQITVVVGGSGAGKSVLLRILAGLLPQQGQSIAWSGQISDAATELHRPRIGIVFQQFALFDELSSKANVQFAIDHRPKSIRGRSKSDPIRWTATEWLEHLGVPPRTTVSNLSGGQKQRLAIARTLAAAPEVLLYDEPTSGLDSASGKRVADLIKETQSVYHRTSIVVTHDYATLLPIADKVLLFDAQAKKLIEVPPEQWSGIPDRMVPVAALDASDTNGPDEHKSKQKRSAVRSLKQTVDPFWETTGGALVATLRLPLDLIPIVPKVRWAGRFTLHYLRLVAGPSAWIYLIISGLIIGFTSTYFTFRFLPFRLYTQPLLIDELLSSIGFALYRVLVPILATILIAARCGAAVAADVGVKQYGGQVDAMRTLGVTPKAYLLLPIVAAFLIGTPLLEGLSFYAARFISMATFSVSFVEQGPYFWRQHFDRNIAGENPLFGEGWRWVLLKNLICGLGTATIAYYRGLSPKQSAGDVSRSITSTVLWTTLFVLTVHFTVALFEF